MKWQDEVGQIILNDRLKSIFKDYACSLELLKRCHCCNTYQKILLGHTIAQGMSLLL